MSSTNKLPENSRWISIDLGAENLRFAHAAEELKSGAANISILSKSAEGKSSVPALFTIKNGKPEFGVHARGTTPSNIIADSTAIHITQNPQQGHQGKNSPQQHIYAELKNDGQYILVDGPKQSSLTQTDVITAHIDNIRTSIFPGKTRPLGVVIVVPSFSDQQYRKIVRQAAENAGFLSIRLLNQSLTVAIAIKHQQRLIPQSKLVAIVNIGARCVECSVLDLIS